MEGKMYIMGHSGLTLLFLSLAMIPFGYGEKRVVVILLAAMLSGLPDIDINLHIPHRTYTHSALFALIMGALSGWLFYSGFGDMEWFGAGFAGAFLGILSHLLGDAFTHHSFRPLWPFSHREVALHWFGASNRTVNEGLLSAGGFAFLIYFMATNGLL